MPAISFADVATGSKSQGRVSGLQALPVDVQGLDNGVGCLFIQIFRSDQQDPGAQGLQAFGLGGVDIGPGYALLRNAGLSMTMALDIAAVDGHQFCIAALDQLQSTDGIRVHPDMHGPPGSIHGKMPWRPGTKRAKFRQTG